MVLLVSCKNYLCSITNLVVSEVEKTCVFMSYVTLKGSKDRMNYHPSHHSGEVKVK